MQNTHFSTYRVEVLEFKPQSEEMQWKLHSVQSSEQAIQKLLKESNECLRVLHCTPKGRKFVGQNFQQPDVF